MLYHQLQLFNLADDQPQYHSSQQAQIIIETWRKHYRIKRPHRALRYQPPTLEAIILMDQKPTLH